MYDHRDSVTSRRKCHRIVLLVTEDGEPDHCYAVVDRFELSVVAAECDKEANSFVSEDVILKQSARHECIDWNHEVIVVIKPPDDRQDLELIEPAI